MDWYNENIEEPIRDLVKILRDNGFNTTCSCGHNMDIEGDIVIDYDLKRMQDLFYNYYCSKNLTPNYEITFFLKVKDGYIVQHYFHVRFNCA